MSEYFTESEIKAKLDSISSAMDVVLSGGKSYRLNDGQGDIQVTRETLGNLQASLTFWENKYRDLTSGSGIVSIIGSR